MTETANYESQFAHRFTEEDEAFQRYVLRPASLPPLVEDWRARGGGGGFQRGRDNRFQGSRQHGGPERDRGWGRGRNWGRERGGYRNWAPGGGYQNSYSQKPHYSRS